MPQTIDEVIIAIHTIVNDAKNEKARFGYFSSLYLEMTKAVKTAISQNRFDDGPRMEKLVVIFAGRYLSAFEQWRTGKTPSQCWLSAFNEGRLNNISVIQHLLCGINAHVNLDLGIAAATVCQGSLIKSLERDFNTINDVIASLVDTVQLRLGDISWPMRWLDRIGKNQDEAIANFCMGIARKAAWKVALDYSQLHPDKQTNYINTLDLKTAKFGKMIISPGMIANFLLKPVKWYEPSDPLVIINKLNQASS